MSLWNNDNLQFARLLSEMYATITFTNNQRSLLCQTMDLRWDDITDVMERADDVWQRAKAPAPAPEPPADDLDIIVGDLLHNTALVDLRARLAALPPDRRAALNNRLVAHVEKLVRMSGYIEASIYDADNHKKCVKASNSLIAKVRRALGFAQPRFDVNF